MRSQRGLHCRVLVPQTIDWERDYSAFDVGQLVSIPANDLAAIDPLAMNLLVAKGITEFADLKISHYQSIVNQWVSDFTRRCLPKWEPFFHEAPDDFRNDIRYFRMGMVCQYLEQEIGIEYNLEQRESKAILYTNPADLFLNGLIDTNYGTCGNMAALHVAFAWRMGWPVSLACVNSHDIVRYDDGETTINIEATHAGFGTIKSDPDDYLIRTYRIPDIAIDSGSDLRALRPHELLGRFVSLRARHLQDVGKYEGDESKILACEPDWLLARQLFPTNRTIYKNQMVISIMRGALLFGCSEAGHPYTHDGCLVEIREMRKKYLNQSTLANTELIDSSDHNIDNLFFQMEINP